MINRGLAVILFTILAPESYEFHNFRDHFPLSTHLMFVRKFFSRNKILLPNLNVRLSDNFKVVFEQFYEMCFEAKNL